MADEHHGFVAEGFDQAGEGRGDMLEVVGLDDRAVAVSRLVPCVRRIAEAADVGQLVLPGMVPSTHAVQEQKRSQTGFPSITTGLPSSSMVQWRNGRSKWPSVWRPATSLAPVE